MKDDTFSADDKNIQAETVIVISKIKVWLDFILITGSSVAISWILLMNGFRKEDMLLYIVALIIISLAFMGSLRRFWKRHNTIPQIIINNKGLQTISTQFYPWSEIKNEDVIGKTGPTKIKRYYLIYDHPGGSAEVEISYLKTNSHVLSHILKVYRGRNSNRKN